MAILCVSLYYASDASGTGPAALVVTCVRKGQPDMSAPDSSNSSRQIDLAGHVALITGGGRGLGLLVAQRLAAAGAAVAVVARTRADITATAEHIASAGGKSLAVTTDVTDRQAVDRMVMEVGERLGAVDVLVNNAGLNRALGPVWEVDPEQWWRDIEVNLRGPFLCARAILPSMIARGQGRIINVASAAGLGPLPAATAYAASKAALINFTNTLASETEEHGIKVFAIQPGILRTSMNDYLFDSAVMRQWHPWFHQLYEERREDLPEPALQLVVALASGLADALSGRFIDVDTDIAELVRRAETIVQDDLYTLRLRT
jgi:NAD(P)-dependent dehydrogenase (short-subunit alcohol dehydrogenase family)